MIKNVRSTISSVVKVCVLVAVKPVASVVALAVVAVIILIAVIYVWWKTRDLRRNLRENPPGGRVIDGEGFHERD